MTSLRVIKEYCQNECSPNTKYYFNDEILLHRERVIIPRTLIPHHSKVACDVLEHEANNYLVIVDFYSKWIELIRLKSKTDNEINK